MDQFKDTIKDEHDYNLCALYCDYHEWLQSPATRPRSPLTREAYQARMNVILAILANRHKTDPFDSLPRDHPARLDMGGTGNPDDYRPCATCHLLQEERFNCDGTLGRKCPHFPLQDEVPTPPWVMPAGGEE